MSGTPTPSPSDTVALARFLGRVSALMVTPLDQHGRLSEGDFVSLIRFVSAAQVDGESISGLTVCGEMGEGFCLTREDRARAIRLAKETVGPERSVIAVVFALSLKDALEQAESCIKSGADALLITPMAPLAYSEDALIRFFRAIAESCDVPLIAYLNKMFREVLPSPDTLRAVYEVQGVVGIKDSTGDRAFMERLIEQRPPGKLMIQTVTSLALAGVQAGADGLMVGSSNIAPEAVLAVWAFGGRPDPESQARAIAAQERLERVMALYRVAAGTVGGSKGWVVVKEALAQMGVIREEARYPAPPYELLPPSTQREVAYWLKTIGGTKRFARRVLN